MSFEVFVSRWFDLSDKSSLILLCEVDDVIDTWVSSTQNNTRVFELSMQVFRTVQYNDIGISSLLHDGFISGVGEHEIISLFIGGLQEVLLKILVRVEETNHHHLFSSSKFLLQMVIVLQFN